MLKSHTQDFSFVRMLVLAASLLLMPFSAFASGFEHPPGKSAAHTTGDHQAHPAMNPALNLHSAPVKAPLHCHQKSPAPQAMAWVLDPSTPDQPPPAIAGTMRFAPAPSLLNRNVAKAAVAGPPYFILFGNFRS